ncbi:MAG: hypothetical protein HZB26_26280 [Candidatus Hydrogenedentes bacterium]|nr:hypothetical protein [Candidatus Hydrogenedentota bacterium]
MKAFAKVFIILAGLALIGLSVAALVLFTQFDAFGKTALERVLSYASNAPVTIQSIAFLPAKGTMELCGFTVSNPKGFKAVPAMSFEKVSVEFDYATLFSETPTIRKVLVKNGKIDLRYDLGEGSNLARLARHAARFSTDKLLIGSRPTDESVKAEKPEEKGAPRGVHRKFLIQEFRCEGISVTARTDLLPASAVTLELAPFTLSGVNKDRPVTAGEATAIFLRSLLKEALSSKNLLGPAADALRLELDGSPATDRKK